MTLISQQQKDKLKTQLIKHEGMKNTFYLCSAGKPTIGVGRNLADRGITTDEAMMLLDNDITAIEQQLYKKLPFIHQQSEVRKQVLINMAFNLGVNGLLKFRLMLAAIEQQDYDIAAKEMLDSRWARQVGNRSLELAEMMKTNHA